MSRRLMAAVVLAVFAIQGCATTRARPTADIELVAAPEPTPEQRLAKIRQDCHQWAAISVESGAFGSAVEAAGLSSIYLVLRGAADGAWFGFLSGGGSGAKNGAWIGAAAGAGLGLLIGVGVGVKQGAEAYGRYRAAFDACVAERSGQSEPSAAPATKD